MKPLNHLDNRMFHRAEFHQRFGYSMSFVATRSGLTRWQDFFYNEESEPPEEPEPDHFSQLYPRAIDEVYYKRAVEQYYTLPDSFVFSIPIDDDGATNSTLVTASRAIFVGNETMKAPAAVVGFQMKHMALHQLFKNITHYCVDKEDGTKECFGCGYDHINCYLVDNHGYIVAANETKDAGRFLGEVNGLIMMSLIERDVFEKINVVDYQAVCFRRLNEANRGSILQTPLKTLTLVASWLYTQLAWGLARFGLWNTDYAESLLYPNDDEMELGRVISEADESGTGESEGTSTAAGETNKNKPASEIKDDVIYDSFVRIKRTRIEPCDREASLYLLRNITPANAVYDNPNENLVGCDHMKYIVQPVGQTNMILLVVDGRGCSTVTFSLTTDAHEITMVNSSHACQKKMSNLSRIRPKVCIRSHPRESEIKDLCGRATSGPRLDLRLLGLTIILVLFALLQNHHHHHH